MYELILAFSVLGIVAGVVAGLLGIGGGLIVVPGLAYLFQYVAMPNHLKMHMAVGTSLATMILTSLRALYVHQLRQTTFWPIFKRLLPGVVLGTIAGTVIIHFLHTRMLEVLFGLFLLSAAWRLLFISHYEGWATLPREWITHMISFGIGVMSGLLGIGGGTLVILFLTSCSVPMYITLAVSSAVNFVVATVGSISFMVSGLQETMLPAWSTGYIYWPAGILIMLGALIFTPVGVSLSYRLPVPILRRLFGMLLFVIGLKMLL